MSGNDFSGSFVERVAVFCERLAITALFAMTALIMIQMLGRELFTRGLPEVDELARWSGLCLVYLATPLLFLRGQHVNVDIFLNLLSGRWRTFATIIIEALTVLFALAFLIGGWMFMQRAARYATPALGMPNLLFFAPALIGMAFSLVAGWVRLKRAMSSRKQEPQP